MEKIIVYTDGGSRGNPGHAGIGVVVQIGDKVHEIAKYIGEKTNNQAEYTAVVEALLWLKEKNYQGADVIFNLDSQLVVEQLNGNYKMKNEGLMPLYHRARELVMELGGRVTFTHILREKNVEADRLVNKAINNREK